jgi:hypothetical protein
MIEYIIRLNEVRFYIRWRLRVYCDGGSGQLLSVKAMACAIVLALAFGAAEARATPAAPTGAIIQVASNSTHPIHDLGNLPPPPDSDSTAPASASSVGSAEPVPELPTWAMMILCLAGLGLARFKRGRKNRLSQGIE